MSLERREIEQRRVEHDPVVPKDERPRLPPRANLEVGRGGKPAEEEGEDGVALSLGDADDASGKAGVDEDGLEARDRVDADDGVDSFLVVGRSVCQALER